MNCTRKERYKAQQTGSLYTGRLANSLVQMRKGAIGLVATWDPEQVISKRVREGLRQIIAELELWDMPLRGAEIDERHYAFCRRLDHKIGMACLRIMEKAQ